MGTMQTTSLEAYNEIRKTLGNKQAEIFNVLLQNGKSMTNSELAKKLEWSINTVTPRIFELRGLNLVTEDTKRPCLITGRRAIAWRVTEPGERISQQLQMGI